MSRTTTSVIALVAGLGLLLLGCGDDDDVADRPIATTSDAACPLADELLVATDRLQNAPVFEEGVAALEQELAVVEALAVEIDGLNLTLLGEQDDLLSERVDELQTAIDDAGDSPDEETLVELDGLAGEVDSQAEEVQNLLSQNCEP